MAYTKNEQMVLDVIDGKEDFKILHYKKRFGSTKRSDKATKSLITKGVIELDEKRICRRRKSVG